MVITMLTIRWLTIWFFFYRFLSLQYVFCLAFPQFVLEREGILAIVVLRLAPYLKYFLATAMNFFLSNHTLFDFANQIDTCWTYLISFLQILGRTSLFSLE